MAWFKRDKVALISQEKKELPDGLWLKCDGCGDIIYKKELDKNFYVCSKCNFHFRIKAKNYIKILLDNGKFEEFNENVQSVDPLKFKGTKRYADQLRDAVKNSGSTEAVRTGIGTINNRRVVICIMDFSFIGGSMGSVVGERISRSIDQAVSQRLPLIIVSASGGARMMEGALSLMQMAKTSAYLTRLESARLPFISIVTDPTTGGVTASYAMLGDIIIAEPGALIGFAGPRVIKQTIGQDLPEGFQRAEFMLQHGFIDAIFSRHELKEKLSQLLEFLESNENPVDK